MQAAVLLDIERQAWFSETKRDQVMIFGNLPAWAVELAARLPFEEVQNQVGDSCAQACIDLYMQELENFSFSCYH